MQPEATTQKEIKRRARRTVTAVFAVGILMLLLNLALALYARKIVLFLFGDSILTAEWQQACLEILLYFILTLPCIFVFALLVRKNPFRALSGPLDTPRLPILYLIMTIGLLYLLNILVQSFLGDLLTPFMQQTEPNLPFTPAGMLLYVVNIAVLPALLEEWLFRGMMLKHLRTAVGSTGAVLISATVFGLMHLNPPQSVFAFGFGLFVGYAYLCTGSIWFGVLLHFTNNLISCFVGYQSAMHPTLEMNMLLSSCILLAISCAIISAIIYGVVCFKKRKVRRKTPQERALPRGRTVAKQVFLNPTLYLLIACYVTLIWFLYFYKYTA